MRRPGRWKIGAVVAVVAVVAVAVAWSLRSERPPEPAAPSLAPRDVPAEAPSARTCVEREPLLLEGRYALSLATTTHVVGQAGDKSQDPGPITTTLEGTLEAAPGPASEVALRFTVRAADLSEMAEKLGSFGMLKEALGKPWRMTVERDGSLGEVRFAADMPPSVQALLHQVAEAAQVAWPKGCDAPTAWEADERQVNGPVRVSYTRAGHTIRKKFADSQENGLYRADGAATITTDDARIEVLEQDAATHVRLQSPGAVVTVDGTSKLRLRRETAVAAIAEDRSGGKLVPLDRAKIAAKSQHALDKASVNGRNFDQLVDALEKASAGTFTERGMARTDLESLLRLEPVRANDVVALLRSGKPSGGFQRALVESLTETPEGTAGLVQLFSDRHQKPELRRLAASAATFAEEPTTGLAEALVAASTDPDRDVALAAIVAQGGVIAAMRVDHPVDAEPVAAEFLARAEAALPATAIGPDSGKPADLNLALTWLQAIAVTRAPGAYPILVRALTDEDSWVRAAAISGLRYYPTEETAGHLAFILREDPEPGPRERALMTAFDLGRGLTFDLVKKSLLTDKVNWVRIAAADTIGAWALYRPGLVTALQEALETEKDEHVRETLQNYITPGRGLEGAQRIDPFSHLDGSAP